MVELDVTEQGTLEFLVDKWDIFLGLLALGFGVAVVIAIVAAGARLGWRLWPYVLAAGFIGWMIF